MIARLLLPLVAVLYLAARWTFAGEITVPDGIAAGFALLSLLPVSYSLPALPERPASPLFGLLLFVITASALHYYEDVWTRGKSAHQAVVQDEFAYLFQANTFAAGRLAFPTPPDPVRFDAFHVLTTPTYAGKYPPGHALLLAPAARAGRPWIGVHMITAAGLVGLGLLARPLLGPIGAPLLVFLFAFSPAMIQVATTYLSQTTYLTAAVLFLLALRRWIRTRGTGAGAAMGLLFGWAVITRPYNAVLLATAVLIAFLIARPAPFRTLFTRALLAPLAGAFVCAAFLLVYNHAVTGSPLTMPWSLYSAQSMPGDGLGFAGGPVADPTQELGVAKRKWLAEFFYPNRSLYTLPHAWKNLWRNTIPLAMFEAGVPLLLLFVPAAFAFKRARRWAFALAVLPVLGHAFYFFYWFPWPRYYHETFPALLAIPVLGAAAIARRARDDRRPAALIALAGIVIALCLTTVQNAQSHGNFRAGIARYHSRFYDLVARRVEPPALVFVRYGARHNTELDLINNEPDLDAADIVYVHHEPGANRAFHEAHMPDRAPYFFNEDGFSIVPGYGPE
ncbi:MAG: hypothetical protein HKN20_04325 [Gemmatimonadetes bacterium]|nr:hypothetical protein [Gemmatimonadota bacterium]